MYLCSLYDGHNRNTVIHELVSSLSTFDRKSSRSYLLQKPKTVSDLVARVAGRARTVRPGASVVYCDNSLYSCICLKPLLDASSYSSKIIQARNGFYHFSMRLLVVLNRFDCQEHHCWCCGVCVSRVQLCWLSWFGQGKSGWPGRVGLGESVWPG